MIRMNYKTLREILTAILVIYRLPFRFEPVFGNTADRKTIIHYYPLVQTAKTVINYLVEFGHIQTTW